VVFQGGDYFGRTVNVAQPPQPPVSATEREPPDSGVMDHPAGRRQPERVRRSIELAQERPSLDPSPSAPRIDDHPVHRPEVDHHPAVGR
jgi:hypothetical protein